MGENSHLYVVYDWGTPIILCMSRTNLNVVLQEINLYIKDHMEEEDFRLEVVKFPTSSESGLVEMYIEGFEEPLRSFYIDFVNTNLRFY